MQLRPKVECFDLTVVANKGYALDCSMFERLILSSKLPSALLSQQHRMRTEIAQIIKMTTYPDLIDHPSVYGRPHVRGIGKDLIFINHRELEDGLQHHSAAKDSLMTDKSKTNSHEVAFCVELVRLLLLQGYKQSQMVVLTPYLGQLLGIQRRMRSELVDVNTLISEMDAADLMKVDMIDDLQDYNSIGDENNEEEGNFARRTNNRSHQRQQRENDKSASKSGAKEKKKEGVRVSTVDNYQREEAV